VRLHFYLTPNIKTVPFDYQHYLIGAFHKWMGWNEIHDGISLYSLSWLQGGKMVKDGFNFPNGARWFISFWAEEIGKQLIMSAMKTPEVCCGMKVQEIQIQETPQFGSKEKFITCSPILIRKYDDKRNATHLTYKNEESDSFLTDTLKKKLRNANLNFNVKVSFDKNYQKSKTKVVQINGIKNKANYCPVIIEGDPEAIQFAWNVGVGHSTGCGFGALK
jgi:CRISPR-associated endoribonuclease Cas6